MLVVLHALVALAFHLLLGWQWSLVGGVAAGLATPRFGWLTGLIAVTLAWTVLVLYNFIAAPSEMARFLEVTAGLLGNMHQVMLVVSTLALGALLGALGGGIGSILRNLATGLRPETDSNVEGDNGSVGVDA